MINANLLERTESLLVDLGMDRERSNERSAMTFLALAHMDNNADWSAATNEMYTIRQIMDWIRDEFGVEYAANTRETIRRFTLHQFVAGGIVQYNADDPTKATNSPKSNYRIAPPLLPVIRAVDTPRYEELLEEFLTGVTTWNEQVAARRRMNRIPVRMPNGMDLTLSAGGQNVLIKSMVEEFCPRFVPGGTVLYIDDTDKALGGVVDNYDGGLFDAWAHRRDKKAGAEGAVLWHQSSDGLRVLLPQPEGHEPILARPCLGDRGVVCRFARPHGAP